MPSSLFDRPGYEPHTIYSIRHFNQAVIWENFPDCCLTADMKYRRLLPPVVCAQDEMSLNFETVFKTRGYSSASIFSLALYVDIRYVLGDQVRDPYDQLRLNGAFTKAKLEEHIPEMNGSTALRKECKTRIKELDRCFVNDFIEDERAARLLKSGVIEPSEKHFHLKRNPVWSGLFDFRCRLVLNDLGLRFICESSLVVAAAFVYYAVRIGKDAVMSWPMMDRFITVHGGDRVFQGVISPDESPMGLLRRFVDGDLDTTATSDLVGFSQRSASPLKAFSQRYRLDDGEARRSMSYLREIIREKFDGQGVAPPDGSSPGRSAVRKPGGESLLSSHVSPVEMLEILDGATTDLMDNQLSVEYFQLHDEAVRLFGSLLREFSAEADGNAFLALADDSKVGNLVQLLPVIYRTADTTSPAETTGRLEKVVGVFCASLPRQLGPLFPGAQKG